MTLLANHLAAASFTYVSLPSVHSCNAVMHLLNPTQSSSTHRSISLISTTSSGFILLLIVAEGP